MGLDQFVLTPGMVALFFTSMSLLEGKGLQGGREKIAQAWWPTLQKNWMLFSASPAPLRSGAVW